MIPEQTKLLLLGGGVAAFAKFGLGKEWKTALLIGAGAIVALTVYDAFSHPVTAA